jgi:hypothetical protein
MTCMPWRPLSKNATVTADIILRLQLTQTGQIVVKAVSFIFARYPGNAVPNPVAGSRNSRNVMGVEGPA